MNEYYTIHVTRCNGNTSRLPMRIHSFETALAVLFGSTWNQQGDFNMVQSVAVRRSGEWKEVVTYCPHQP